MKSAKDFLIKACDFATDVLVADSLPVRDRAVSTLTGYLLGLRDAYLVMDEMFEDISQAAVADDDDHD
jgi:hypothetical protein